MSNEFKIIESLLHFDRKCKEAVEEYAFVGNKSIWLEFMTSQHFFNGRSVLSAVQIVNNICLSGKTNTEKVFALEAVEGDFSLLALHLGHKLEGVA